MSVPVIGQKDKGMKLKFTVRDTSSTVVNLTGATVTLSLVPVVLIYNNAPITVTCTIDDPINGIVSRITDGTEFLLGGVKYQLQLAVVFTNGNQFISTVAEVFCRPNITTSRL